MPVPAFRVVKTWFMKREDGYITAVDEGEAWRMLRPSQYGPKPKWTIVGVSYPHAHKEAQDNLKNIPQEERKQYLRDAFNKAVEEATGNIERPRNPNILNSKGNFETDPVVLANMPR